MKIKTSVSTDIDGSVSVTSYLMLNKTIELSAIELENANVDMIEIAKAQTKAAVERKVYRNLPYLLDKLYVTLYNTGKLTDELIYLFEDIDETIGGNNDH